jgi:hypothetical protein
MTLPRDTAPKTWLDKNCFYCGREFQTLYSFTKYCSDTCCEDEQQSRARVRYHETSTKRERKSKKWMVQSDPDEYGLFPGLMLDEEQIKAGLRLATFTPGTVLYHKVKHKTYQIGNNKMVEVK